MKKEGKFSLKNDLYAGVVVFLVALPLCLGIALASGAPLFSGLIAGILGGIVIGSVSNSSLGVSGPAAGLAVIVLNAIESLGGFEIFIAAVAVCGFIQIVLGFARAGIIGHFFPTSVIKGMLAGIGIIIVLKQIPHAVGYDGDPIGDMSFIQPDQQNTFSELANMFNYLSPGAIIVSLMALGLILVWDNYLSKKIKALKILPGALVAVIAGILYKLAMGDTPDFGIKEEHLVNVPVAESLTNFFSFFQFPAWEAFTRIEVWTTGALMAIIASLETLLSVEAIDKLDPRKRVTNKNREMIAQGVGNTVSGFIGGMPITQVIVRSSANAQSGGDTKRSTIFHGFLLLFCVMLIPDILNLIPLAVLASVLFIIGYKLASPALFKTMYRSGWSQFIPFIVTIVGVVLTDLLQGIIMGLAVAIFIILRNSYKNSHFLHKEEISDGDHKIKMTFAEEVTFLNKGAVRKSLTNIPDDTHVTIDLRNVYKIDPDVQEIIDDFMESTGRRNIQVEFIHKDEQSDMVKRFTHTKEHALA